MSYYAPRLTKRQLSQEERLRDVQEDLEKLLRHAQALQDENKQLKKAVPGSTLLVNGGDNQGFKKIDLRASPELPELKHFRKRPTGLRSKVLSASSLFSSSSIFSTSSPDLSLMNSAKFSRSQSEIIDTANSMGDITEVMTEKDMWRQQAKCLQKELLQWKRAAMHSQERLCALESLPTCQTEIQANTLGILPRGPNFRPHPMVEQSEVYPSEMEVTGFMKQFGKYAFAIQVSWTDGRRFEIYRKYGEFFNLQNKLFILFPVEAGKLDSAKRTIPTLPAIDNLRVFLGASNSRNMMQSRLLLVSQYCTELLNLPKKISHSKVLVDFFMPRPGDTQLESLTSPRSVDDLELDVFPQDLDDSMFPEYEATADFAADSADSSQLSLSAGEVVILIKEESSGWWYVCKGSQPSVGGYVPASFLRKVQDPSETTSEEILGFVSPTPTTPPCEESEEIDSKYTITITCDSEDEEDTQPASSYIATSTYHTEDPSQLSFLEGAQIRVLEKNEDGWWYGTHNDEQGWIPMSYLKPCTSA